jgi:hypothetical protein
VNEELFWNADIGFVRAVCDNKAAFDNYINVQQEKILNKK